MMALQIPPDCDLCPQCQTSSSGGGGGTGGFKQYYQGHGEPNSIGFLPEDTTIENLYTDLDTQILYAWVPSLQTWV